MNEISYSYVALLDVLAYKEYLERDQQSGHLNFRDAMEKALSVFRSVNQVDFGYSAISDTIIVTCAPREKVIEFLRLLKRVQISFLRQGLFLRGAAVYAQHFHNGNLTYSPALAKAYQLEQEAAIYPRIIIDNNILEMFLSDGDEAQILKSQLIVTSNGIFFLNILDKRTWGIVFEAGRELFRQDATFLARKESAFAKHVWFENYLFSSAHATKGKKRYIPPPRILDSKSQFQLAKRPSKALVFSFKHHGRKPKFVFKRS